MDFDIEVVLSSDENTGDYEDLVLQVDIAANDVEKRYNGIEAGGVVYLDATVTLPAHMLNDTFCEQLADGNPQFLVQVRCLEILEEYM